ncbi:phosphoadenylyl-sulfate reductase [Aquirufa lenticrescens]|uniref:phosphoadenylyl-sulfate reductase n=1 Tax=Aquirufa lenticrescens TaxID=2696560 RepID=UPI001CAA5580|nr:phosphoadenylyl-sulfate reductase [Aquirufa lenticrescens]UAJ14291.1 phosphoadenylyl-sulfate reductase [Aquirufa lenticrescens]
MHLKTLEKELLSRSLPERIQFIASYFAGERLVFSTSFGQEDQAITQAIASTKSAIEIFTLDTGRQFQESYELMDLTIKKYGISLQTFFPNTSSVETLVAKKGFNSFYSSVENRKECCFVRKMEPLNRALQGAKVWITGLRAEQSDNRADMPIIEWDENRQLWKINPLIDWNFSQLEKYLQEHKIPQNPLHKKGFISIGCAPCTRAISEGEHPRAGRWWWENSQKECGLHA